MSNAEPIACTLSPGELKDRLGSINELARQWLRNHRRMDLLLELDYAPEAVAQIRQMVEEERRCCAFLSFELRETDGGIRVSIRAPEEAREAAGHLFEQFTGGAAPQVTCGCSSGCAPREARPRPDVIVERTAIAAALTTASAAVVCGAACVLPILLPGAALAGGGAAFAIMGGVYGPLTSMAILLLIGAWASVAWQSVQRARRPSITALGLLSLASILSGIALYWPQIEPGLLALVVS